MEYSNLRIVLFYVYIIHFRVLLKFGGDPESTDDLSRRPVECIPDEDMFDMVLDAQVFVKYSLCRVSRKMPFKDF